MGYIDRHPLLRASLGSGCRFVVEQECSIEREKSSSTSSDSKGRAMMDSFSQSNKTKIKGNFRREIGLPRYFLVTMKLQQDADRAACRSMSPKHIESGDRGQRR